MNDNTSLDLTFPALVIAAAFALSAFGFASVVAGLTSPPAQSAPERPAAVAMADAQR